LLIINNKEYAGQYLKKLAKEKSMLGRAEGQKKLISRSVVPPRVRIVLCVM